jgi:hypothetical protein
VTIQEAVDLVLPELRHAQRRFPAFHSGHEGYAVIAEELDELWEDVKRNEGDGAGVEAVQVAAMALRYLVDLCDHESVAAMIQGRALARLERGV